MSSRKGETRYYELKYLLLKVLNLFIRYSENLVDLKIDCAYIVLIIVINY